LEIAGKREQGAMMRWFFRALLVVGKKESNGVKGHPVQKKWEAKSKFATKSRETLEPFVY
jgi:hypothetical protein